MERVNFSISIFCYELLGVKLENRYNEYLNRLANN